MKYFFLLLSISLTLACTQKTIYKDDKYKIQLKNIVSYYLASPDLYVKYHKKEIKINLNNYGVVNRIPQEKIDKATITEVNNDSIIIQFIAKPEYKGIKEQFIYLNITKAIDEAILFQN